MRQSSYSCLLVTVFKLHLPVFYIYHFLKYTPESLRVGMESWNSDSIFSATGQSKALDLIYRFDSLFCLRWLFCTLFFFFSLNGSCAKHHRFRMTCCHVFKENMVLFKLQLDAFTICLWQTETENSRVNLFSVNWSNIYLNKETFTTKEPPS